MMALRGVPQQRRGHEVNDGVGAMVVTGGAHWGPEMELAASTPTIFLGKKVKNYYHGGNKMKSRVVRVMAAKKELDEGKQTDADRWKGLAYDISDDQQDITRGKGIVDSLFQAPMGDGTHEAILSSYEYISQGLRKYDFDNTMDGLYIAPAFMDKLIVHLAKNFMTLPNIKVPLILGIWEARTGQVVPV
ncbi:hypothetical protein ZWY2020_052244 [Hordeum vulgare]|nr:hypothetical protein ZWY2020_052244 [Hordeum vulgare]